MSKTILIFIITILHVFSVFSQPEQTEDQLDLHEQLLYSTVKIICYKYDKGILTQGSGTGFYFDFAESENVRRPYIITNKHVVENSVLGGFELIQKDKKGNPDTITQQLLIPNFVDLWIPHPDSSVDLCIMPLASVFNEAFSHNIDFFYKSFRSTNFPTENEWQNFHVIENVLIVGYPIGLIDTINNIPLIRTGTTSSPPFLDYNGRKEFVIDAACFPGSSGSPIIFIPSVFQTSKEAINRFLFLGVLYAGPLMKINGEIVVKKINTTFKPTTESYIPINLGYIIKSNRIDEFRKIIDKK